MQRANEFVLPTPVFRDSVLASRAKTITSLPLRWEGIESTELNMVKWLLSKGDLDGRCKYSRTNYFKGKKRPDFRVCMLLFSSSLCMHQRLDFLHVFSKCLVTKYNLNRCHTSIAIFSVHWVYRLWIFSRLRDLQAEPEGKQTLDWPGQRGCTMQRERERAVWIECRLLDWW